MTDAFTRPMNVRLNEIPSKNIHKQRLQQVSFLRTSSTDVCDLCFEKRELTMQPMVISLVIEWNE